MADSFGILSFTAFQCMQVDIPEAEDPDDSKAKHLKRKGDEAFVKGNFKAATEVYTQALRHTTSDSTIWANRSAASLRTGAAQNALQDARCARTLKPGFAKVRRCNIWATVR